MPGFEDRASILHGAGDMIFKLVCDRSTPEQWAEWLRAPLEHAAGTANHDLMQKLLKAGANGGAGWKGCHGKTLLHAAAEGGDDQVVTALIRAGAGADKNAKDPDTGRTPLHLAALGGREAVAKVLIMAAADVNILDSKKDAPLHLAIESDDAGIAEALLLGGANHAVRGSKGDYPIHLAACHGENEIVRALVQRGANLDRLNRSKETPLAIAVREDRVSTVEVLLAGGADANFHIDTECETVLHHTARLEKPASIPALIEAGADIEARDTDGCTPLYLAAGFDSRTAMLALLQLGAIANAKDNDGGTPLHNACLANHPYAANLLLRWGADETIVDNDGKTPSSEILPDVAEASEGNRLRIQRLTKLLAHAPQDRAWRRRGFVVMCRAHQDRLRLAVETPDNAAEAIGQQPQERPSRRPRMGQVKVEVQVGDAHGAGGGGGAGSSSSSSSVHHTERRAGGEGVSGGFDGVAAWLMAVTDGGVFRNIVGFL